jgi:hypothetical protein
MSQSHFSMFVHSPVPVHSSIFSCLVLSHFFVRPAYKKMTCFLKYIQSFTQVCSVKSSIESGYVYQQKINSSTLKKRNAGVVVVNS